ncbi:hypothetical protein [Massilia sp. Leaf139]|uniref:hypothetical protein n=1 Tax=Massilia sp. Leaf139 TaxID=1736272 RepID=UPI0007136C4C|nr:hypothetical protein [Massilia sp. Leaf139]KQQ97118.1 hypothetical protein ASF77_03925 [Massilia sp. Leaf139]
MRLASRIASLVLALTGSLLSTGAVAADPGFCHSVCDSERRACKADVAQLAAEDGEGLLVMQEKNQLARTASRTGAPTSIPVKAGEQTAVANRRIQRTAACETAYGRCERSCKAPEAKAPVSPIYTPRKSG